MSMTVRRCASCGREDYREQWMSLDAAAQAGALQQSWSCPSCSWPEADLVASSSDTAPKDAGPDVIPGTDPVTPTDPDEARRAIQPDVPLRHP